MKEVWIGMGKCFALVALLEIMSNEAFIGLRGRREQPSNEFETVFETPV
jgi:hypothetical protein